MNCIRGMQMAKRLPKTSRKMDPKKEEFIKIDFKTHNAKVGLWVFVFPDDKYFVSYIPSLKLSAYGNTEEEALSMLFDDILDDFFKELFKLPEVKIREELDKCGWKKPTIFFRKKFSKEAYVDEEGVLRNFNLPAQTKVKRQFMAA